MPQIPQIVTDYSLNKNNRIGKSGLVLYYKSCLD